MAGKSGRVLSSKSDAIGFLYRDDDSNTILSFNTGDNYVQCGARPKHLINKDAVLGEMQENGELVFHWDRIFPSLSK